MIPTTATFDEFSAAIDAWARYWLIPVTVSEAAAEFGISVVVTEAAIGARPGLAIGDAGEIVAR